VLSLVLPPAATGGQGPVTLAGEPGLADVMTLQRQRAGQATPDDEELFFADTLAEYQWARDVAGLAPSTLERLTRPMIEVCEHFGLMPWKLTPRHIDQYFAGPGKRASSTVRQKLNRIDGYFAFVEQRYGGEIARRFGCVVESPVPRSTGPGTGTGAISGCGCRHHRRHYGSSSPPGGRACRTRGRSWSLAGITLWRSSPISPGCGQRRCAG
jgi:hypothetical protein